MLIFFNTKGKLQMDTVEMGVLEVHYNTHELDFLCHTQHKQNVMLSTKPLISNREKGVLGWGAFGG